MQKIFVFFLILPTLTYALYNPFFTDLKKEKPITASQTKIIYKNYIPKPKKKRQSLKITYFGFVESTKGKFALVNFNEKNIVIKKGNSLYLDDEVFKVVNITSNNIIFKDKYSRVETVYFSSENRRQK